MNFAYLRENKREREQKKKKKLRQKNKSKNGQGKGITKLLPLALSTAIQYFHLIFSLSLRTYEYVCGVVQESV